MHNQYISIIIHDDHLPSIAEARRTPLLPAASMGGFGTRGAGATGATAGSAGVGGRVAWDHQWRDVVYPAW